MLSDEQQNDLDLIESELEYLQCKSEDCILIDDAKDLMDAVDEQEALVVCIISPEGKVSAKIECKDIRSIYEKIETIMNNLQSVLDKDKELDQPYCFSSSRYDSKVDGNLDKDKE